MIQFSASFYSQPPLASCIRHVQKYPRFMVIQHIQKKEENHGWTRTWTPKKLTTNKIWYFDPHLTQQIPEPKIQPFRSIGTRHLLAASERLGADLRLGHPCANQRRCLGFKNPTAQHGGKQHINVCHQKGLKNVIWDDLSILYFLNYDVHMH